MELSFPHAQHYVRALEAQIAVFKAATKHSLFVTGDQKDSLIQQAVSALEQMRAATDEYWAGGPILTSVDYFLRRLNTEFSVTGGQPIHEQRIRKMLLIDTLPNQLEDVIQGLIISGFLQSAGGVYPNRHFTPGSKKDGETAK